MIEEIRQYQDPNAPEIQMQKEGWSFTMDYSDFQKYKKLPFFQKFKFKSEMKRKWRSEHDRKN